MLLKELFFLTSIPVLEVYYAISILVCINIDIADTTVAEIPQNIKHLNKLVLLELLTGC